MFIPKLRVFNHPDALTEIKAACVEIVHEIEGTKCYPISGNTLKLIEIFNKYQIPFKVEVDKQ